MKTTALRPCPTRDNDPYYSVCLINGKSEFEYFENIDYTDTLY